MHADGPPRWAWLTTDRRQAHRGGKTTPEQRAKAHLKRLIPGGMFANRIPHTEMIWGPRVTTVAGIALCPVGWAIPAHGTRLPTPPVSPASPLHGPDWLSLRCGAGAAELVQSRVACKLPGTRARALAPCRPTSHPAFALCFPMKSPRPGFRALARPGPRLGHCSHPGHVLPLPGVEARAPGLSPPPGSLPGAPGGVGPRPSLPSFQVVILAQDSPLVSVPCPHR